MFVLADDGSKEPKQKKIKFMAGGNRP